MSVSNEYILTFRDGPAGGSAGHRGYREGLGVGVLGGDGGGGQPVQQHLGVPDINMMERLTDKLVPFSRTFIKVYLCISTHSIVFLINVHSRLQCINSISIMLKEHISLFIFLSAN